MLAIEVNKNNGTNFNPGASLKSLWLATITAAFFGPLLALNNFPGFFAYKILFAIHLAAFSYFLAVKKIELKLSPCLKPYFLFFTVWLGWALISLLWSDNKIDGIRNIWYLFSGLSLVFFTVIHIQTDRDIKALVCIFAAIFLCVLGVGLWENWTGQHLKTAGEFFALTTQSKMMPRGFFKNPNDLATYLVLYLPLLYAAIRYCSRKLIMAPFIMVFMLAAGAGFYLVLQTGSRANMVALMPMAVAAAGLYLIQYRWKALRNLTLLLIGSVLFVCFLIFTVHEFNNWSYRQYSIACHQLSSLKSAGSQESARVVLIRNSVTEIKQHSLMGVGAGNAEEHMKKYRNDSFDILALHNWWLEILVNYGAFVFILYLTFYLKLLYELFMVAVKAGPGLVRVLGEISLLAMIGFPFAAFSSSSLIYSRFMWIIFGVALCAVNIYRARQSSNDKSARI